MIGRPERGMTLGLLAVHLVGSVVAWFRLRETLPVTGWIDVDAAGRVEVGAVSWFTLPVGSIVLVALTWLAARRLARRPLFMGLLAQGRFRKLSDAARQRVLKELRRGLELAALPIAVIFLVVQIGMYDAAMGRRFLPWVTGGLIFSLLTFSTWPIYLRRRAEGAVAREWEGDGEIR